MPRDGSGEVADLWAMATELEQQFAGYKQRLAERNGGDASGGGGGEAESGGGDSGDVRGRMYGAYVRRRDERLRRGWLARMERKEAEVKAFWAQLELSGRASGERAPAGGVSTTTDAGDEEGKTERNDDDDDNKRRSADAALAPRRISGKKHARTRSFSSPTNPPGVVGRRRALSQEPPSSEPRAAGGVSKGNRARPAGGAATATPRPKASLRRKNSVKGHGGARQTGPTLPRRAGSGGLQDLGGEVVPPSVDAAAPVLSRSDEQDVHGETPKASPPRPSTSTGDGTGAANARTASPDSDRSEVVDAVPESTPKVKNADVKKRGGEDVDASSPDKPSNPSVGGITSDSDIESSYVYICKDVIEEHATSLPRTPDASAAVPEFRVKTNEDGIAETTTTPPAGDTATGIATTTNAEEAPQRESSGESSFSGGLGRSPLSSAAPSSSSSQDQSVERVLETDAALPRKKRAQKSALKTPGSAGSMVSGTAWSPKWTPRGFKRFLSFGKKNRAREVTVIDCTSPSVSSVAGDDSGRWQSAGSVKPRMGSSDAASDDADHGQTTSPRACSLQSLVADSPAKSELDEIAPQVKTKSLKAHRSLFSFLWLNCGRG